MDDSNKLIQQQFGANADKYVDSPSHARGSSLNRLVELTQPQSNWQMLDVSTGAGHTAIAFAPHVAHVIATDLTPEMLAVAAQLIQARGVTNVEFKEANAENLPFDDNAFDLVTNRIALHHYREPLNAIYEMARVCKIGGLVALNDNIVPPNKITAGAINHFEQQRDPSHHWCYPAVRLEQMLSKAGLQIEHTETLTKEMEFEPWADRMGASAKLKAELRQWLDNAPEDVRAWLLPRHDGEKMFFTLHEVILVGRKNNPATE